MRDVGLHGFTCCRRCVAGAELFSRDEQRVLLEIDAMKPAFTLWSRGRREDSPEECAVASQSADQPAKMPCGRFGTHVFIGDLDSLTDVKNLKRLNIGFVLNLCPERFRKPYAAVASELGLGGIVHVAWPAYDHDHFDILSAVLLAGAGELMDNQLRRAHVLVNCWGGVNRSATVAIGYLALWEKRDLLKTVQEAMQRRGRVLTNKYFRQLLVKAAMSGVDAWPVVASRRAIGGALHAKALCAHPARHQGDGEQASPKYGLINAARDGCLQCVRFYVEAQGIDKNSNDKGGYTAKDWAQWQRQQRQKTFQRCGGL